MRIFTASMVLGLGLAALAQSSSFGRDLGGRSANDSRRIHASTDTTRSLPRGELERVARSYGPRGTIPGVIEPETVRADFSRATRFDLETHARRHGPSR